MKAEQYRGGWKIIGTIRDALRGSRGLSAAGDADAEEHMMRFPADIIFTDFGVLVVLKGEELNREEYLALQTTVSHDADSLTPEQVQKANESLLYSEIKDVRLSGGKEPSRWSVKLAGDKPVTRVWLTRAGFLGIPVTAVEFYAKLSIDEVLGFLQRMPLAGKIRR